MPLPTKQPEEEKNAFTSRCMSDDMMKKEFPDNKQRVAATIDAFYDYVADDNGAFG